MCTLHQVELALRWTRRVVGLREGAVILDVGLPDGDGRDLCARLRRQESK